MVTSQLSVHYNCIQLLIVQVNNALEGAEVSDADQFDELVVSILSSEDFINNMVQHRDVILSYSLQDPEQTQSS